MKKEKWEKNNIIKAIDFLFFLQFSPGWRNSMETHTVKTSCNAEDQGSIPGSGKIPWRRNGYPHQYSCLENEEGERGEREKTEIYASSLQESCLQGQSIWLHHNRDLFKKIRDTKGTFHAKMDTIKDRNGMDLPEADNNKKRWQEYTEELYKKKSSWPR